MRKLQLVAVVSARGLCRSYSQSRNAPCRHCSAVDAGTCANEVMLTYAVRLTILLLMSVSGQLHSRIGIVSCVVWLVHGVTYQGNEDIFLKEMSKHETSRSLTSLQFGVAWEFIHHHVYRRRSHLFRPGVRECSWWSCFWWVEMPHELKLWPNLQNSLVLNDAFKNISVMCSYRVSER
jgi:hypothetical protein